MTLCGVIRTNVNMAAPKYAGGEQGCRGFDVGLFSVIGNLIGGSKAKKASKRAEAAQIEAAEKGIVEQRRQFDLTRSDYAPYLASGVSGLADLGDLIGINGADAQSAGLVGIQNSPALASIIRNGEEAILANASATGGLRGGNIQRGLADFRSDSFVDQLNQQISRLAGLAGLGQGATDSVSAFGANTANNVTDLLGQQGQARANGLLARGGINASLWNNVGSFADSIVSSFMGGGSGGLSLGNSGAALKSSFKNGF